MKVICLRLFITVNVFSSATIVGAHDFLHSAFSKCACLRALHLTGEMTMVSLSYSSRRLLLYAIFFVQMTYYVCYVKRYNAGEPCI